MVYPRTSCATPERGLDAPQPRHLEPIFAVIQGIDDPPQASLSVPAYSARIAVARVRLLRRVDQMGRGRVGRQAPVLGAIEPRDLRRERTGGLGITGLISMCLGSRVKAP